MTEAIFASWANVRQSKGNIAQIGVGWRWELKLSLLYLNPLKSIYDNTRE